jgi:hypothetical protein
MELGNLKIKTKIKIKKITQVLKRGKIFLPRLKQIYLF